MFNVRNKKRFGTPKKSTLKKIVIYPSNNEKLFCVFFKEKILVIQIQTFFQVENRRNTFLVVRYDDHRSNENKSKI